MFLVSALEAKKTHMRSILCLHEAVCTGAADGYARMAAAPAVALLHLGPGLGNGLCNLHNAHRARSPVLVLVGEHATWHKAADPPLAQDIHALAATVSGHVLTITSPEDVSSTVQRALTALATPVPPVSSGSKPHAVSAGPSVLPAGCAGTISRQGISVQTCPSSRVVTLVLPHDISWAPASDPPTAPASLTVPALLAGSAPGPASASAQATQPSLQQLSAQLAPMKVADSPAGQRFLSDCAAALAAAPRGKAALVLGGAALLTEGELTVAHWKSSAYA